MQAERFWTKVYQRNIGKMIGVNCRYVKDKATAEDLAHEAFIRAIEKSDSFRQLGHFDGWLMRINLNNTLDYLRRQPQFLPIDEMEEAYSDPFESTDEAEISPDDFTEEDILEAIHHLPDRQRTVFNLYVFENQKHTKIAEMLQIGVRSSKRYLAEARTQLQGILKNKHNHKKSGIMVILSLLSLRGHAVDRICRAKLGHLVVAPSGPSPLAGFKWATAPKSSALLTLSAAKVPAITTGVLTTAVAGSVAVWQIQPAEPSTPTPAEPAIDTTQVQTIEPVPETDTISFVEPPQVAAVEPAEKQVSDSEETEEKTITMSVEELQNILGSAVKIKTTTITVEAKSAPKPKNHSLKKVQRNGYCGLANELDQMVVEPRYSDIGCFDEYRSGWALVDLFGFKGFVDSSGREVVHPQYDEIGKFGFYRDGLALVRKGNFYGFIDLQGNIAVPVAHSKKELINHH